MTDAVKLNIVGLKCDNPDCDYVNVNVNVEDYEKWLNAKCPKCGEILLTEEDYENVKMLMELTKMTNAACVGIDLATGPDEVVNVKMNGTGAMKFERVE